MRASLKPVIWSVVMSLLIVIAVAKFAGFADNPEMLQVLDAMPQAVLDAMDMQAFNLTTLNGFYGLMFLYFALMGAVAAAMWGSTLISKEERDRTVEFSLVLPVSRSQVITAKALAALAHCAAFVLITGVTRWLCVPMTSFHDFCVLRCGHVPIELISGPSGCCGCAMKHYKRSARLVSIILGAYMLCPFGHG